MLKPAYKYQTEINNNLDLIFGDEHYKYYFSAGYYDTLHFEQTNWYKDSKVSVDKDNKLIGFIQAEHNRHINSIHNLQLINFSKDSNSKLIFGKDIYSFFKDMFQKYNINKINFRVCIGNPIEISYNKIVQKFNGKIVGVLKDEYKLWDQKLYDAKIYEIMNPFNNMEKDK